ncbi:hypothetical protein [Sphingobium sp. RAC03]|uniref:hypothetical protein n=1 Tax=Sphingobium sp. RAC03 TaxID=1843368 RepID=UPI00083D60CB|nr:hypothetical protein [Sphingobium sp. RAC03]AOF97032.1 hypothetical protein BSY17_2667 [Sphingobium sp. RAC03]
MDDNLAEQIAKAMDNAPRVDGIDWSMALGVGLLRALEARMPGLRNEVREQLITSAEKMEASDVPEQRADAPSVRELADSWIFME